MVRYRSISERPGEELIYVSDDCLDKEEFVDKGITEPGIYACKEIVENGNTIYQLELLLSLKDDKITSAWIDRREEETPITYTVTEPLRFVGISERITNQEGNKFKIDYSVNRSCVETEETIIWKIRDLDDILDSSYHFATDQRIGGTGITEESDALYVTKSGILERIRDIKNDQSYIFGNVSVQITLPDGNTYVASGKLEHPITFDQITIPDLIPIAGTTISARANKDYGDFTYQQILVKMPPAPRVDDLTTFSPIGTGLSTNVSVDSIRALGNIDNNAHTVNLFFASDTDYTDTTFSGPHIIKLEHPIEFNEPVIPDILTYGNNSTISIDINKDSFSTYEQRKIEVTYSDVNLEAVKWNELNASGLSSDINIQDLIDIDPDYENYHTVHLRFTAKTDFSFVTVSPSFPLKLEKPLTMTLTAPTLLTADDQTISATAVSDHGSLTIYNIEITDSVDTNGNIVAVPTWRDLTTNSLTYSTATISNIRGLTGISATANTFYIRAVAKTDFSQLTFSGIHRMNVNYPITLSSYTPLDSFLGTTPQTIGIIATSDYGDYTTRKIEVASTETANDWTTLVTFDDPVPSPAPISFDATKGDFTELSNIDVTAHNAFIRFVADTDYAERAISQVYEIEFDNPITIDTQPTAPVEQTTDHIVSAAGTIYSENSSEHTLHPFSIDISASANYGVIGYNWEVTDDDPSGTQEWAFISQSTISGLLLTTEVVRAASSVADDATISYIRCLVGSTAANVGVYSDVIALTLATGTLSPDPNP